MSIAHPALKDCVKIKFYNANICRISVKRLTYTAIYGSGRRLCFYRL